MVQKVSRFVNNDPESLNMFVETRLREAVEDGYNYLLVTNTIFEHEKYKIFTVPIDNYEEINLIQRDYPNFRGCKVLIINDKVREMYGS